MLVWDNVYGRGTQNFDAWGLKDEKARRIWERKEQTRAFRPGASGLISMAT